MIRSSLRSKLIGAHALRRVPPTSVEAPSKMSSWQGFEYRRARLKMIQSGLLPMMQRERRWLCRMTSRGAAALLTYYVDAVTATQPEVVFPELDGNGRPFESKSIDEPRRDFAYFIVRNVTAALSNMAAAGDAVEQHGAGELPTGLEHRVLVGAAG
jgi:hypothetical protein